MSNDIFTEYLTIDNNGNDKNTHIRINVWYEPEASKRGYYVTIVPVERDGYFEKCALFSGFKCQLLEVSRKSKKREQEAIETFNQKRAEMIERLLKEKGYALVD